MLKKLLKLHTMAMATGVTSPMPHLVGPPGSGKSSVVRQLADLLGVQLHTVNVSRISPLSLEGLEMPEQENNRLRLLISELWTKAKPGDIYLFDEFLRGFPEVYNGLLDIFTAREVAGYRLPPVFIIGASNSTTTYDGALEDRLLHIMVRDPRKYRTEKRRLSQMLVDKCGLMPDIVSSYEMEELMDKVVLPTFELLDHFSSRGLRNQGTKIEGSSLRNLIGQVKLREVQSNHLRALIEENNRLAMKDSKPQYVVLLDGKRPPDKYHSRAVELRGHSKLTPLQAQNLELNLQLIEMEEALKETNNPDMEEDDDDTFTQ